ncbi:MAG: glycosyltransferase family 4 protein [Flavobacteriales bacterium]|nr:glycosyltransferase family 4 protein [Flavobacteriales bacterium]
MSQPLHICHITTVHTDRYDTRIFRKECTSLARAGYTVELLVADGKGDEEKQGVHIRDLGKQAKNRAKRILRSNTLLLKQLNRLKADVFHFHDPELIPVFLYFKRKRQEARVVFDIHENFSEKLRGGRDWIPSFLRAGFSYSYDRLEQQAQKRFDGFVGATDGIAEGFPKERAISLHNYPELNDYEHFASPSEDRDPKRIVYTGGFTAHRGVTQIIDALPLVEHPVELHVYGRKEEHIYERCASTSGFKKVVYHGKVDLLDMLAQVHRSSIGLVCNQPEGGYQFAMPNKLFEYMACSIPVIASEFPHWQKIVDAHQAGITVDSTDPSDIAQAIDTLLADPEKVDRMGRNARQCIEEKYNWKVEFAKLERLYHQITSSES